MPVASHGEVIVLGGGPVRELIRPVLASVIGRVSIAIILAKNLRCDDSLMFGSAHLGGTERARLSLVPATRASGRNPFAQYRAFAVRVNYGQSCRSLHDPRMIGEVRRVSRY